jgi:methyl coenzyme M reductase subunit D
MSRNRTKSDIEIIPRRLMDAKKADELVAIIKEIPQVETVEKVTHNYRGGGFLVGRFIVIISENAVPEVIIEKMEPVLNQMMPYGYDTAVGVFVKPWKTVKDYIKEASKKNKDD